MEATQPEQERATSLTAPQDRPADGIWRSDIGAPPLTEPEVGAALQALNNTDFIRKFPKLERRFADGPIPLQKFGLISFVPAKGATPNEDGMFGIAKLRGNYDTPIEASERAEMLIRDGDSYHTIFHAYVGRPFPITASSKWSAETEEVDIRKAITSTVSADIKQKKKDEQKEVEQLKDREQALRDDVERDDDPYETYITLKVKHAQLAWTYLEHHKKMEEVRGIIEKTRKEVADLDAEFPTYKNSYFEKYMAARRDAGFADTTAEVAQDNFMKFLVEDAELPNIDFNACKICCPDKVEEVEKVEKVEEAETTETVENEEEEV